jgi:hypothetical protein
MAVTNITPLTPFRLTAEDLARLRDLQAWCGLATRTATLRYCVDAMHDAFVVALEEGTLELPEPQAARPSGCDLPESPEISDACREISAPLASPPGEQPAGVQ